MCALMRLYCVIPFTGILLCCYNVVLYIDGVIKDITLPPFMAEQGQTSSGWCKCFVFIYHNNGLGLFYKKMILYLSTKHIGNSEIWVVRENPYFFYMYSLRGRCTSFKKCNHDRTSPFKSTPKRGRVNLGQMCENTPFSAYFCSISGV